LNGALTIWFRVNDRNQLSIKENFFSFLGIIFIMDFTFKLLGENDTYWSRLLKIVSLWIDYDVLSNDFYFRIWISQIESTKLEHIILFMLFVTFVVINIQVSLFWVRFSQFSCLFNLSKLVFPHFNLLFFDVFLFSGSKFC